MQLISAQTNSYIWVDTYNRKLTDVAAVEGEIARGIAESLQVKLTAREAKALAAKPTNDLEAYYAYLRGLAFDAHSAYSNAAQRKTIDAYARAVNLTQRSRCPGRDFPVRTRRFTSFARTKPQLDATLRDALWKMRKN